MFFNTELKKKNVKICKYSKYLRSINIQVLFCPAESDVIET